MWKLLRNLVLATILLAGVLKLLAWYEVGQDAQRLTAALAPYAQLRYDSVSAGLDGSVSLSSVDLVVKREAKPETYHADNVVLETPNIFWLLKHTLLSDDTMPPRLGVSVQGLRLPPLPWLDRQWLDPATLAPFANLGCDESSFTPADYHKMGVTTGDTRQRLDYRFDAESKTLNLTVTLSAPTFASVVVDTELHPFDPQNALSIAALQKLSVGQLGLDYTDNGFMQHRNAYCAQRASLTPEQFVDQHFAALRALLQQKGIGASNELLKLYRHLVESGGHASILSLPNSNFVAGAWGQTSADDLLRQLNMTARYGDTPPVMFRLTFPSPVEAEPAVAATADANPAAAAGTPTGAQAVAATPSAATAPAGNPVPAVPAATTAIPPPLVPVAKAPDTSNATTSAAKTVVAPPTSTLTPPATPGRASASNLGLQDLDRAETKMPPAPKPVAASSAPSAAASTRGPDFPTPSEPPPPPGSTLALVWKPTFERLPPPPPERHDYRVIEFANLREVAGRRVRLITTGGKRVEGYVITADEADVDLRVNGVGGDAEFVIPKGRIQEVQLLNLASPPA
jgi:hypothetical protein